MEDPRLNPRLGDTEALAIMGDPVAYRQQLARDVEALAERADVPSRVLARDEPCADPASCDVHAPARTLPAVPEWVQDPAKWVTLSRADRRALERHHRKQQRR